MDVTHILENLNDSQRDAATAPLGNALVVAGAGSGKTRVLMHRIAWLIEAEGVSPFGILAVTFTNKAAQEMRVRIEELLNLSVRTMWVGTFHGIAHRLLRMHWQEAGLPQNFQILDADDQLRLVKRVMRVQDIDEQKWPARQAVCGCAGSMRACRMAATPAAVIARPCSAMSSATAPATWGEAMLVPLPVASPPSL